MYGTIICLSGLVNLSQYGIDALTLEKFDGNSTPVNVVLAVTGFLVGVGLVTFIEYQRRMNEQSRGGFGDPERQPLISGGGSVMLSKVKLLSAMECHLVPRYDFRLSEVHFLKPPSDCLSLI